MLTNFSDDREQAWKFGQGIVQYRVGHINGEAVALLCILEGYPETDTIYRIVFDE